VEYPFLPILLILFWSYTISVLNQFQYEKGTACWWNNYCRKPVLRIRIRIRIHRIHMFLASRIQLRIRILLSSCKKTLISTILWFFWPVIFEKWCKCAFKKQNPYPHQNVMDPQHCRKQLMENPHYETGSQDLVLISCGESQVSILIKNISEWWVQKWGLEVLKWYARLVYTSGLSNS
jgi:hypothetical protein